MLTGTGPLYSSGLYRGTGSFPGPQPPARPEASPSPEDSIRIDKIFIIGNRKTKEKIIRRELDVYSGMVLAKSDLEEILKSDREKILNLRLFLSVEIEVVNLSGNKADLIISVRERWYFFPSPIFQLADRNFTEWWVNQQRDMSRVDYGVRLKQYNFRGRNETVSLTAQFGYTKLFRLAYRIPYIDRDQKLGLYFYGDYATKKNLAVLTMENRLVFADLDYRAREGYRGGAFVTYRRSFYNYHQLGVHFASSNIADTIAQINPNYFSEGALLQRYFGLEYSLISDHRDNVSYALNGWYFKILAMQTGIGIYKDVNIFRLDLRYSKYADLGKKFFFATNVSGSVSFPQNQPFNRYNGIGFNKHFIRGFERYIIYGQHYIINNNSLKWQLLNVKFSLSNIMPIKQFSSIPFAAYITANFDQGYVANYKHYEDNDRFTNRYLAGGGIGLDIVSFYDFVMRWEYSFNIAGESALYLNILAAF